MARIVFVGNCQVRSVCNAYDSFVSPWTGDSTAYIDAYEFNPAAAAGTIRDADVVVGQVAETKANIDIDEVPAHAVKLRIPVVSGGFLWPFGGQPHPKSISRPDMPLGPYSAEFGDSYLNRLINKGVDAGEILQKYLQLDINKLLNLDRLLELNLEKQRNRDLATGFRTAEIIEEYFRDEPIFLTPYHPNLRVARYLIQETFRRMKVDQAAIDRVEKWLTVTPFPATANPIHPSVQRHFGLKYAGPGYRYRFYGEGTFTFEEYVRRYLGYEWNELLEDGFLFSREQKLDVALEKLTAALQRSPQSCSGFIALSGVLERLGRMDEAIAAARKAAELEPDHAPAIRHLGVLLARTPHLQEAERLQRQAIELSPGSADYYFAFSHLLQRQQRIDDAVIAAQDAIERDPLASHFLAHYGALLEAKGRTAEAEQALRRAIALAPAVAHTHGALSRVLAKQNKLADAIAAIRRAVELEPDAVAFLSYLGHLLTRDGQYAEAETVLRRALELAPDNVGVYGDLCHVLDRTGRRDEATALLRHVVANDNSNAHIHAQLGHLLLHSGDLAAAESEFRAASAARPDIGGFSASLADVLNRQGRRQEAVAVLRGAIARDGNDPHIHGLLGHILLHARDLEGAEREFRMALEKAPDAASFRVPLADVLRRLGRRDEAAALL